MSSYLTWFGAILAAAALIVVATGLPRRLLPGEPRQVRGGLVLIVCAILAAVLVGLCALVRLRIYDRFDAAVVGELAHIRSRTLVTIFTVLTTMGDVIPSFLVATIIGFALLIRSRRIDVALLLPVMVVVEVLIQNLLGRVAGTTISTLQPGLSVGGAGPIPSGSVSRLYLLFMLGCVLWARYSTRAAAAFVLIGQALILIELVSRLYLGRHFLIDIAGGLLFGVLLMLGGSWLLAGLDAARRRSETRREQHPSDSV